MKVTLGLVEDRPKSYMVGGNHNVTLEIVHFSLSTRGIVLRDDCHKKQTDLLVYTPVEFNYLETLGKTFITPARQNQFSQKTFSSMLEFIGLLLQ